jgi:tRNA uridine 5-carbamoylmethylation protein Kti12
MFDDFLKLRNRYLGAEELIIFTGSSGSGKTTYLKYLLTEHPDIIPKTTFHFSLDADSIARIPEGTKQIIIDEILRLNQLEIVFRLLAKSYRLLLATHLNHLWFVPFKLFWSTKVFKTDLDQNKIANYLTFCNIDFSKQAIKKYCRLFSANYTDLEIILERYPALSFDEALLRFEKFCLIEK